MRTQLFLGFFVWATAVALDSGDNKFMKDYAMLKVNFMQKLKFSVCNLEKLQKW